jgi:hypothetical protein
MLAINFFKILRLIERNGLGKSAWTAKGMKCADDLVDFHLCPVQPPAYDGLTLPWADDCSMNPPDRPLCRNPFIEKTEKNRKVKATTSGHFISNFFWTCKNCDMNITR